ncbi:MAG: SGNH/GDSL hydrolase family protein [Actinomycetota bacterium]
MGLALPGLRRVTDQIAPYTEWWDQQNQDVVGRPGPLLVALGDSTTVGIGASAPERGYVGCIEDRLRRHDGRPWRTINLALSGARIQDALDRQLPIVEGLIDHGLRPDAVVCCIGTNDVVWERGDDGRMRRRLQELTSRLPPASIIGVTPGRSSRARLANRTIRQGSSANGLLAIDPWNEPGPAPLGRLASDRFHPNDVGYELMSRAFARAMGLRADGEVPDGDPARR